MSRTIYYVYAYLRKDKTPYYIGKGCKRRAYLHDPIREKIKTPSNKENIIFLGLSLLENEAFELEKKYIKKYGRKDLGTGILRNRTNGGEGVTGSVPWNKNKKTTVNSNCNGKLNKLTICKNILTGETRRLRIDSAEWLSGEYVGINKGKISHPNTIKAAKAKKGIKKPIGFGNGISKFMKNSKWYYNQELDKIKRISSLENIPSGFIQVSGPHKKIPI